MNPSSTKSDLPADRVPLIDISRIIKYAPERLIGRETETALLDVSWQKVVARETGRPHVLGFVALGGEGKTSLVAKWLGEMAGKDWPGCESVFAWSFYSQGSREQVAVSSDLFLAEALRFFGDPEIAASAQGAYEKGKRLAELVGGQPSQPGGQAKRNLLILDGVEPLQYPPTSPTGSRLKDQGIEALLKGLAASSNGLCIVTTRYSIPDLAAFAGSTWHEEELKRLSREAGVALLKDCGVKGSERPVVGFARIPDSDDQTTEGILANPTTGLNEFEQLVEEVQGHALTLQILGQYLKRAHHGDIRRRDRVELAKADDKVHASHGFGTGHAFRAIAAYEAWLADDSEESRRELAVLRLLGLFDRPATADCVQALLQPPTIDGLTDPLVGLPDEEWEFTLSALSDARLVSVNRAEASGELLSLDAHPLIREYFAMRLKEYKPDAQASEFKGKSTIKAKGDEAADEEVHSLARRACTGGEVWRAAHRRLYEHLCETTEEGDQPTLEDLQPLYQAIAHGCHAGLQQETHDKVWFRRIRRRNEYYSIKKLGAFGSELGAVALFFEPPWSRVSSSLESNAQAVLLNFAAIALRSVGRLTEALEPMRGGLDLLSANERWDQAAGSASNLSELELTLGDVPGAVSDAERSVTYADRSGDAFLRMGFRTTHADALHQSGRRSEAESLFREAEQMQAEHQPSYPLLYSQQGFIYCDLLLAPAEREAWKVAFRSAKVASGRGDGTSHGDQAKANVPTPSRNYHGAIGDNLETCRAATDRANKALLIVLNGSRNLLDIALNHLTLSHSALYESLLSGSATSPSASPLSALSSEIEAAVSGLRRASRQDYLPGALLTRAWQRSLLGRKTGHDSAKSDLDEAWETASRGPMPLFMADIHLYRARLFFDVEGYPWESVQHDLAEARRLIKKHGYGRRMDELNDAEESLRNLKTGKQERQPADITSKKEPNVMSRPTVFISYSHDSDEHRDRVLGLSERLRKDGIETILDRYVEGSPDEGWPRWMLNGLDAATHVICVCTETYYRRFRGQETVGGKGVDWEGALITQALYDAKSKTSRFIPVLYDRADEAHIPEPLRAQSYYLLNSEANYSSLYDQLLGKAGVAPGELGEPKTKSRPTGKPATFGGGTKADAEPTTAAASRNESPALKIWRDKLDFLLVEEAICSDPKTKFSLKHDIDEARQKIRELEGDS